MKTLLALFAILTSLVTSAQSIEISPNGGTTNASAILDLKSTTKGFLLPRMTNAQMRAIPSPAQGLLAFCTDCGTNGDYYFYKGTAWVALGSTTVSVSTTVGSVSANANENGATITNGGVLNLAPANATNPGIVTTTAQTIAGAKTFSSDINVNGITVGKGAGSGSYNTANGYQALYSNTTGGGNTANGSQALNSNTTGKSNTATGNNALYANTTGGANTANGNGALVQNITGNNNTATGFQALLSNTNGFSNTATGLLSLSSNTTGFFNTANGDHALEKNITGAYNTAIGYYANVASGDITNATAIGANATVNASNKIQLGNGAVTAVQLGTGTNVTLETGLVKITGGTPGAGKVLTSDAAGLASWTSPSSSGIGVDLTTAQTIAGVKTFSNGIVGNVTGNVTGNASTATSATTATNVSGVVAIANGGTGTTNGSITGTGALTFAAGGSNQNISITPSGTGSVGIGTTSPNTKAALDVTSTTKGFLPPRLSSVQRNDITNPTEGLVIYNSTKQCLEVYRGDGWFNLCDNIYVGRFLNILLGGKSDELSSNIQQTSDGGYIISGFSFSSANGNVSDTNHGNGDYWIVKLDALGNIVWNKLLGGMGDEIATCIQQTSDGGYIIS